MTDHANSSQSPDEVFKRLAEGSPRFIQGYLENEAPQTAAAILLTQSSARAAQVLSGMSADARRRVVRCLANSRPMMPPAKAALAQTLDREFPAFVPPTISLDEIHKIVEQMSPDLRQEAFVALQAPAETAAPADAPEPQARSPRVPPAPVGDPNEKFERWPLLELVYDRFVRGTSTALRRLTGEHVEVSLANITSLYFANYLNTIPLPAMLGVFQVKEWPGYGMVAAEPAIVEPMLASLLGGRNGIPVRTMANFRPFTVIERDLFNLACSTIMAELSKAFDIAGPVTFDFERVETNPRFTTIAPPMSAVILARLDINLDDSGGRFELLLPYESLTPIRELMLQTIEPLARNPSPPGQEQVA